MRKLFLLALALGCIRADEAKLYLQLGHSGPITSVAFSPDGRFVLTGSRDKTARLWDAATGAELHRFEGDFGGIESVAFSPDGRLAVTGGGSTALLWDAASGAEVRRLQALGFVRSVAFSPDGRLVLTGNSDKTAKLWDVATGMQLRQFEGHSGEVDAVTFSPDGRFVLTASRDTTARLWDVATGAELRSFRCNDGGVRSIAFSPDGLFVVAGSENTAWLWNAASGAELRSFDNDGYVASVAFSPDGRFLLTGGYGQTVRMWEAASGAELRRFEEQFPPVTAVVSVAFSPNGHSVLIGSNDNTVQLWDVASERQIRRFEGHSGAVLSVAFSADARFVLTCNEKRTMSNAETVPHLWDAVDGTQLGRLEGSSSASAVAPSNGRALLTSGDSTARLWDAACWAPYSYSFAHSPDRRLILTGGRGRNGAPDGTARLLDAASGAEIRRFEGHSGEVTSVAFSPDGRFALTGSIDETARLWDVGSGAELRRFEVHFSPSSISLGPDYVTYVTFSPNGRSVLTCSLDMTARLWDVTTGAELQRFQGHSSSVHFVTFTPDGHSVLIFSADETLGLSDVSTGTELRRFEGHSGWVNSAAFSPDGRYVVTGSRDGTTRLWDASSGKSLANLISFREGGWAVVDLDGRYDASGPNNSSGLYFVAGLDVIELGQLKRRFYTPGLLARIFRGERLGPVANLKDVKLVPGIELIPPLKGSSLATVRLTNRQGGIGQLIVKVNGREVPTATRGGVSYHPGDSTAEVKLDLSGATLSPTGKNVIEVSAFNGENSIQSRGLIAEWDHDPPEDPNPARIFVIAAGVSEYYNAAMNLRYAAKDAVDIGHALRLAALGLYNDPARVKVTVLASTSVLEPTKDNLTKAFDDVAKESRAQDLLIVYFAGHGMASRSEHDQYYYFTKEARSMDVDADSALRAATTVSSSELREWLSRQNMPLKQVVMLDTCAAGAAFGEMVKLGDRRELSPDQVRAIELLKDATGSWILMGSAADAVSYEANRYAQGLLTYALLQGMKGAALDGDQVEVSRLFGYAQRQVEDMARGIGGLQRPILSAPKGQTFPIGLLTVEDRRQIHLATAKPQLLRARVLDDNDLDALKIEPALRAELRTASLPQTRGGEREEPRLAYLDSVVDEVPDALIPQVRYTVMGDKLKVRLRLLQNGKPVSERNLEVEKGDAAAVSKALVLEIVAESARVK